ncbi:hypothetical protein FRC17_001441 [Serendipita sp. 399]|nr:hypothetical protein FRC17_001441 [Serendipita sp. 399]
MATTLISLNVSLKSSSIPYGLIAQAAFADVETTFLDTAEHDEVVLSHTGKSITDQGEITHLLAQKSGFVQGSSKTPDFLKIATSLRGNIAFPELVAILDNLDDHLAYRTYLIGHELSSTDLAIWGACRGSGQVLGLFKRNQHPHLLRFFSHLESLPIPQQVLSSINLAKQQKTQTSKGATTGFTLDLPGAEMGKVVTRFPPEPSGYLHVGHAKAAMLNQYFAKAYKGELLIRFDDTNPANEKEEFERTIMEDLEMMEIVGDRVSHSSDYFDVLAEYAVKIIKAGHAYADDTDGAVMKQERMDGIASKNRDKSVEENLAILEEMKKGTQEGLRWCIRAKISVDDPNKAMRDPVIYRCNVESPHHRTGDKWKVYPTYDFTCPILDSIEGVTHALRANEYRDRNAQYAWFQETLGLRPSAIWDFSRLNFNYTLLSKRKLKKFVEEGLVWGWDDPRFPTIRGLRRRGMTAEALRQYILGLGASQSILQLEWDAPWATNKKVIDPIAPRYYAVEKEDCVRVTVTGGPAEVEIKEMPRHKKNPAIGTKKTVYASEIIIEQADARGLTDGEEITLMDWGNAIVRQIRKSGEVVESIEMELHLAGDFKKTEKKITWLASASAAPKLLNASLVDFDYLLTKKKIEEGEDWLKFVTPVTEFRKAAFVDSNCAVLERGAVIQFERKGYYILDSLKTGDAGAEEEMVFFLIPDGKVATVASKAEKSGTGSGLANNNDADRNQDAKKGGSNTSDKAGRSAETTGGAGAAGYTSGSGVAPMYSVKAMTSDEPIEVTGLKMYTVKPVY